jgi:hypothetical protein
MKVTNPSTTNAVQLNDPLGVKDNETQYQRGVKNVVVLPSSTATISSAMAGESRALQSLLEAGTLTTPVIGATGPGVSPLAVEPNDGAALPSTSPDVPGVLLGTGGVVFAGLVRLDPAGAFTFGFTPGVVGADLVVRGYNFAAATNYITLAWTDGTVAFAGVITPATTNLALTGGAANGLVFVVIAA